MRERAEELGGSFVVRALVPSGTLVRATIPLPAPVRVRFELQRRIARETPCALDVVGIGLLVVETAHPEGFAVVLSFDGEQADPLGGE